MGKNNKKRRTEKKKKREQRAKRQGFSNTKFPSNCNCDECKSENFDQEPDFESFVFSFLTISADCINGKDEYGYEQYFQSFSSSFKLSDVDTFIENSFLNLIPIVWSIGWQPTEVVRHVRRQTNTVGERLIKWVIAADHCDREKSSLHPDWSAQINELELASGVKKSGWLKKFFLKENLDWVSGLDVIVKAFAATFFNPALNVLILPPGEYKTNAGDTIDLTADISDPVLKKVRALLIKAESTEYSAEADSFTAKAHELMTRYSIDKAMLNNGPEHGRAPVSVRLPIDDPYADEKSILLHMIADNYRCRSVFDQHHGLSTLVGFRSDLAATELLFTSLLVQVQFAIQAEVNKTPPRSRQRSVGFKKSFFAGFTDRIHSRLSEVSREVFEEAEGDYNSNILPVLSDQSVKVDELVDELFGDGLTSKSSKPAYDYLGYSSGEIAADQVELSSGRVEAKN